MLTARKLQGRGFRQPERPPREYRMPVPTTAFRLPQAVGVATPVPKEEIVRSPKYLRAVARFDCAECGMVGMSQAAHVPPSAKQRKESDLETFPLCADQAGRLGCHTRFDRYQLYPDSTVTREVGRAHAAAMRAKFRAAGMFTELLGGQEP